MRSVKSELLSVVEVLSVPLLVAAAFPYGAIEFAASREVRSPDGSTASIVFLDEASVARAVRAARTVSRREESGRASVDLLSQELPSAVSELMVAAEPRRLPLELPLVENGVPPFLPSRRSAAPVRISAETTKEEPPFSRDELLKLN